MRPPFGEPAPSQPARTTTTRTAEGTGSKPTAAQVVLALADVPGHALVTFSTRGGSDWRDAPTTWHITASWDGSAPVRPSTGPVYR